MNTLTQPGTFGRLFTVAASALLGTYCVGPKGSTAAPAALHSAATTQPGPARRDSVTIAEAPAGASALAATASAAAPMSGPARNMADESAARSSDQEAYIPAGTYVLGPYDLCSKLNPNTGRLEGPGPECVEGYFPSKTVELKAYFLDRAEVTLAEYEQCVKAKACPNITVKVLQEHITGCNRTEEVRKRLPIGAMSCISHLEAALYCKWKGKRLPSSAEWEVAARGGDSRSFPWGDEFPTNEGDTFKKFCRSGRPCDVRKFGPYGPFRLYGMESGVREWTSSPACESYPNECAPGQFDLKGGAYMDSVATDWDAFSVGGVDGGWRWPEVGFRCARDAS